ncbi:MAG TPA: PA domain-containing protein [Gaiellaceae bacterium]|nr:PA domain-containing protein [Gaiellaceae bacterium]
MRRFSIFSVAVAALTLAASATAMSPPTGPEAALEKHHTGAVHVDASEPTPLVLRNFELLGQHDLGTQDTNGDVWVHGDFAYVGTWSDPCTGRGVKIIDVSDLNAPSLIGTLAARPGTSAEDVVVRHVDTPSFTGDLLATGIQRCGEDPALDGQEFGVEFWDVTDPTQPVKLAELGIAHGEGGVHELDLFQRGDHVYALLAVPFAEWFDPVPGGDVRIVDASNPRVPVQVGEWGAGAHELSPGPFFGQGSFGASYGHSVRASGNGTSAYVSYWDLGVLTLNIRDVTNPRLVSRTQYAPTDDGDAHSVAEYRAKSGLLLLQNDEDFDPRSPARIRFRDRSGIGTESPGAAALWLEPDHRVRARVVRAANEGCSPTDYPANTEGKIVVVRTPFPFFDPGFDPAVDQGPLCDQAVQDTTAAAAGAVAVVHDFIAEATSPQWFDFAEPPVDIPVLFTNHRTAQGMVRAGRATLKATRPSWGFLRVFDAETGVQVAKFDRLPNVHALPPPLGDWSIHNTEVADRRAYSSWYSHGIVALNLAPLDRRGIGDPKLVGQFVPPGAPSQSPAVHSGVAEVWGVAIRASDNVIFASDMNSGLWIVKPVGRAAPRTRGH